MTAASALINVSKRFGRQTALEDVTLSFESSSIVGIVGPNGAGKTTLLRILAKLLRPSAGTVRLGARDCIRYFGGERTLPPSASARRWVSLWSRERAGQTPARRLGVLSRGTRQRIGLEVTLTCPDPCLLLLDEPWEGLDPDASRWLSEQLVCRQSRGSTIVVSSHRIHDLASICDRCEFIEGGHVAAQAVTCDAALSSDERVAKLFAGFDEARGRR
jgi:ABC-type multidrug transport system ATPase subunit